MSGKPLETLHNIVSVLYLATKQSFCTSSCASESRGTKKSPVKCSESLPTACRTEVRSFRTAWSFSHSEASETMSERAAGREEGGRREGGGEEKEEEGRIGGKENWR